MVRPGPDSHKQYCLPRQVEGRRLGRVVVFAPRQGGLGVLEAFLVGALQRTGDQAAGVDRHAQVHLRSSCLPVRRTMPTRRPPSRGSVSEGVRRAHMVVRNGRVRDSAALAITRAEWPAVVERLQARMEEGAKP